VSIPSITTNTLILIMLNSDVPSPCHTFQHNNKNKDKLSIENLTNIMLWAADTGPKMPDLFFITGQTEPLEPSIASVLEDMGKHVITPLLPINQQESLGIPFSIDQTVIANGLDELLAQVDNIAGRPIILNINNTEIDRLAEGLLLVQEYIGSISLRFHNIHLWEESDLHIYEQQLANISDIGLMKKAMGTAGKLGILNLGILNSTSKNHIIRCPAGTGFMAVGPDGYVYPCPAFYHAGKEYSIGPIRNIVKKPAVLNWSRQKCGICDSEQCPGCPFLESKELRGRTKVCGIYEAERRVAQNLIPRVASSGYLFDCLRTLKSRDCASKSQSEGGDALTADQQIYDVKFDEFIRSLQDIKLATKHIVDKTVEDENYDAILNRWLELPEIPLNSQRSIFRRRMSEIITELRQLRNSIVLIR